MARLTTALKTAASAFKAELAKPRYTYVVMSGGAITGCAQTDQDLLRLIQECQQPFNVYRMEQADEYVEALVKRQSRKDNRAFKAAMDSFRMTADRG